MSHPKYTPDCPGTSMPEGRPNGIGTEPVSTRSSVAAQLAKLTLALVLGLSAGWGVQQAYQAWQAHQGQQPFVPTALPWWQSLDFFGPSVSVPLGGHLSAFLVIAGQSHSVNQGAISLPSGSRFQLRVRSPLAGRLSLTAVNPLGESIGVPLWSGEVGQGQEVVSPVLRLEGTRGRETLILNLHRLTQNQTTLSRTVELFHY